MSGKSEPTTYGCCTQSSTSGEQASDAAAPSEAIQEMVPDAPEASEGSDDGGLWVPDEYAEHEADARALVAGEALSRLDVGARV